MRPIAMSLCVLLGSVALAAEPTDTDTPPAESEEPAESQEPAESEEPAEPEALPTVPSPAEAARSAPGVEPSERPPGVPDGWTEVPLEAPSPEGDEELVVWGTAATRAARARLIQAFEDAGWQRRDRRDGNGDIVFKGPEPWMGTARLSDAGLIRFRGRVLSFSRVQRIEGPPSNGMEALDPNYRATAGATRGGLQGPVSKRKLEPHRQALLDATDDELDHLRAVQSETALRQSLAVLPDRLDAVWNHGQSLTGGPPLQTAEERRAQILDFWATRPYTREGRLAMQSIEAWISEVMQTSATPATRAELDAAAARRDDGRRPTGR